MDPLQLYNLHHRNITVQNWGFHFLDSLKALRICAFLDGNTEI